MKYSHEQHVRIGKKVAEYRNKRGWSQDQLGSHIKKSLGWVNKFERGNSSMRCDDEILNLLATALQIPVEWLAPDSDLHADLPELVRQNRTTIDIPDDPASIDELKEQLLSLSDDQLTILKFALISLGQ